MTTIVTIDRASLPLVGKRVAEALEALGDELGLTFGFEGGGRYGGQTGELKITMAVRTEEGAESAQALDFKRCAASWGMTATDLGKEVLLRGHRYTITGANPSARRNPINIARVSDGKVFRGPVAMVKMGLEAVERVAKAKEEAAVAEAARKAAAPVAPTPAPATAPPEVEEDFVMPERVSPKPRFDSGSPFV